MNKIKHVLPFFNKEDCTAAVSSGESAKEKVGNKAANLITMMASGLPVPEGFVLPTELTFTIPPNGWPMGANIIIKSSAVARFAAESVGREFEDEADFPYLVSVRSGSAVSMPGMMDTILNIGLNDHNVGSLATKLNNPVAAFDSYRRLIQMLGTTVHGIEAAKFTEIYEAAKELYTVVDEDTLLTIIKNYKKVYFMETGTEFPQSVDEQLRLAINTVYGSWHSERAVFYRNKQGIDHNLGTAVTIQGMKLGNLNDRSGTGVLFTRDPNTGAAGLYGDWLARGQGEDVVSGICETKPINEMGSNHLFSDAYAKLSAYAMQLDAQYKDMVDIEFTVEDGQLWILQCRRGKRSPEAAVRIAFNMFDEKKISKDEALERVFEVMGQGGPISATVADTHKWQLVGKGKGAAHGIVIAEPAFTKEQVEDAVKNNRPYIFIAKETSPDDTPLMSDAVGLLTQTGGLVSHAALCAREWGIAAVVGFKDMDVSEDGWASVQAGLTYVIDTGKLIKIDGTTGEVWVTA